MKVKYSYLLSLIISFSANVGGESLELIDEMFKENEREMEEILDDMTEIVRDSKTISCVSYEIADRIYTECN